MALVIKSCDEHMPSLLSDPTSTQRGIGGKGSCDTTMEDIAFTCMPLNSAIGDWSPSQISLICFISANLITKHKICAGQLCAACNSRKKSPVRPFPVFAKVARPSWKRQVHYTSHILQGGQGSLGFRRRSICFWRTCFWRCFWRSRSFWWTCFVWCCRFMTWLA